MKRHTAREWTIEEFDHWCAASDRFEAAARAADEEGGPSLSLVPPPERNGVWPTDLLPPAAPEPSGDLPTENESPRSYRAKAAGRSRDTFAPRERVSTDGLRSALHPEPAEGLDTNGEGCADRCEDEAADPFAAPSTEAMPFDGVALADSRKRLAGWSAERQRVFLVNLAETGSVHLASAAARLTARSAYRLRARSPAFAAAWDTADQLAVGRLSAIAFDRAINGRTEQVWRDGELVAEKRLPSDKLLMWLLARLDPRRFAARGNCARTAPPIRRRRRARAFPRCSTRFRTSCRDRNSRRHGHREHWDHSRAAGAAIRGCAPVNESFVQPRPVLLWPRLRYHLEEKRHGAH